MTAHDLPGDRKLLIRAAPARYLRAVLAKFINVARGRWLSWRLRRAVQRQSLPKANIMFAKLAARATGNSERTALLSGAALRNARSAEARGNWLAASWMWKWYGLSSGDLPKATLNLIRCARS